CHARRPSDRVAGAWRSTLTAIPRSRPTIAACATYVSLCPDPEKARLPCEEPMRQLVGLRCVLCQERIESVVEGHFCCVCTCPVHKACRPKEPRDPATCPMCGSPALVIAEHIQQEHEERVTVERDARWERGIQLIALGFLWLAGGIAISFCFFVLS